MSSLLNTPHLALPLCADSSCTLLQVGEKFSLALAPTINLDNTPTDGTYNAVRFSALYFAQARR